MNKNIRKISYQQAISEALSQEMERDPRVFTYGLDVADHKSIFGSTAGLVKKFGPKRCFSTPLSEEALMGFGIGAALNGLRPVNIHIRVEFLLLAMNQLANIASSLRYGSKGELSVPIVIRVIIGRGWGQGYQHSKSLQSFFAHIPGLKVIMPTTPYDMKGLLVSAIRDNDPVICLEHRWLYWIEDHVPEELYTVPIGQSHIIRKGSDVTVVATSWMNVEAHDAANILAKRGVNIEIIDPRTISPLDDRTIIDSVNKTGHCIVADYDWLNCGFGSEVSARVSEKCFRKLKSPVTRIGFAPTPCPTTRPLENLFYPNAVSIVRAVEKKMSLKEADLRKESFHTWENKFRGPF
ncbi:MAG: alpha-ketoacid dehydrogenase subunit beta [Candidatus Yanofskybacteria bacterium]|nr:alpha-ketoacid dehydrogenase subunit beta [Candidatus Yanofskybacteria bacterium]